jgi:hypothetical protein
MERQKDRKDGEIERQKTKRQKDKETEIMKDVNTER